MKELRWLALHRVPDELEDPTHYKERDWNRPQSPNPDRGYEERQREDYERDAEGMAETSIGASVIKQFAAASSRRKTIPTESVVCCVTASCRTSASRG
jgi:hypothetical protein